MSTPSIPGILDLWSDDIQANVLTPVAILRTQVSALSRKAEGILRAEVRIDVNQARIELHLILIAPALNDYQVTLLKASHDAELVYPAIVKSRGLLPPPRRPKYLPIPSEIMPFEPEREPDERSAETQDEFIKVVGDILRSGWVRSLIQSLIARSNDVLSEKAKATGESSKPLPNESEAK
jgi:hypothetical protein